MAVRQVLLRRGERTPYIGESSRPSSAIHLTTRNWACDSRVNARQLVEQGSAPYVYSGSALQLFPRREDLGCHEDFRATRVTANKERGAAV